LSFILNIDIINIDIIILKVKICIGGIKMIKRSSSMFKELKEQMRGGAGTIEITHLLDKDEIKGKARLVARIKINPGCSIGLHEHINEEEIFYIISGKGIIDDNGIKREVAAGDAALAKGGEAHSVENTGSSPLEMIAVILLY
jgi:mannose-6-phosphate isomerase-like protein (cupin superfamily)